MQQQRNHSLYLAHCNQTNPCYPSARRGQNLAPQNKKNNYVMAKLTSLYNLLELFVNHH
jgi:hypothetical protein